jgi:hypothetical protein
LTSLSIYVELDFDSTPTQGRSFGWALPDKAFLLDGKTFGDNSRAVQSINK